MAESDVVAVPNLKDRTDCPLDSSKPNLNGLAVPNTKSEIRHHADNDKTSVVVPFSRNCQAAPTICPDSRKGCTDDYVATLEREKYLLTDRLLALQSEQQSLQHEVRFSHKRYNSQRDFIGSTATAREREHLQNELQDAIDSRDAALKKMSNAEAAESARAELAERLECDRLDLASRNNHLNETVHMLRKQLEDQRELVSKNDLLRSALDDMHALRSADEQLEVESLKLETDMLTTKMDTSQEMTFMRAKLRNSEVASLWLEEKVHAEEEASKEMQSAMEGSNLLVQQLRTDLAESHGVRARNHYLEELSDRLHTDVQTQVDSNKEILVLRTRLRSTEEAKRQMENELQRYIDAAMEVPTLHAKLRNSELLSQQLRYDLQDALEKCTELGVPLSQIGDEDRTIIYAKPVPASPPTSPAQARQLIHKHFEPVHVGRRSSQVRKEVMSARGAGFSTTSNIEGGFKPVPPPSMPASRTDVNGRQDVGGALRSCFP